MRIGIIGRTKILYDSMILLHKMGHKIAFICTCKEEEYYNFPSSNFENFADYNHIPFFNNIRISTYKEELVKLQADICISLNWKSRLDIDVLNIFKYGVLNSHAGDLPRYRGNATPNWAILNRETEISNCIHKMVPELDAGDIYVKKRFPINKETYVTDFYDWLALNVPDMFLEAVNMIHKGVAPKAQCPKTKVLRCYPRKPQDSKINWNSSADDISALIRASSYPFPGAYSYNENNQKVYILKAKIIKISYEFLAVAGQICEISDGFPLISCKSTSHMIQLIEYHFESTSIDDSRKIMLSSLRNRLL